MKLGVYDVTGSKVKNLGFYNGEGCGVWDPGADGLSNGRYFIIGETNEKKIKESVTDLK